MTEKSAAEKSTKNKAGENSLAIGQIVKDSWAIFKKEWVKIYALLALPVAFSLIFGFISEMIAPAGLFGLILELISMFIQIVLSMGVLKAMLHVVRGESFDLDTILSTQPLFFKYVGATILLSIMLVLGFLFFIIPGIYFAITYTFVPYLVVDKEMGVFESMKKSAEMTKGKKWDILAFMIVSLLIGYSGFLLFFVGIFLTAPFASVLYPVFYNRMQKLTA